VLVILRVCEFFAAEQRSGFGFNLNLSSCHSERSEESRKTAWWKPGFLAALGMTSVKVRANAAFRNHFFTNAQDDDQVDGVIYVTSGEMPTRVAI